MGIMSMWNNFHHINCLTETLKNVCKILYLWHTIKICESLTCMKHNQTCNTTIMDKPAKGLALGWWPRRVVVLFILVHPHLRSPPGVPAWTQTQHLLRHSNDSAAGIPAGNFNDRVTHRSLQTAEKTLHQELSPSLNSGCICKWRKIGTVWEQYDLFK